MVNDTIGDIRDSANNDFVLKQNLVIRSYDGFNRIWLGRSGAIIVKNDSRENIFKWNVVDESQQGILFLGGGKTPGGLICKDDSNNQTIFVDGASSKIFIGANGKNGYLTLQNSDNKPTIEMNGDNGGIILRDNNRQNRVLLDANNQRLEIRDESGDIISMIGGDANMRVGTNGSSGNAYFYPARATDIFNNSQATISLNGETSNIILRDNNRQNRVLLDANNQRLEIRNESGDIISMIGGDANMRVGTNGRSGNAYFYPARATDIFNNSQATISLNGETGDITLQNADCAEDFEVEIVDVAEPGTVMVIGDNSLLKVSDQEYDCRVAGIVAGAGQYRPGIILGRNKEAKNSLPIALMGRVNCKVDANNNSIKVGDLLTTSSIPGHAMKVTDPQKAFGTVIGKALGKLNSGTGMIPVLVALQ